MRLAPPLVLILSALTAPAAAGPCSVPMRSRDKTTDRAPLKDSAPECRAAAAVLPDFERLRAAAGFNAETLVFRIDPSTDEANGYYSLNAVFITRAYFLENRSRASSLNTLAHEIGHADQETKGLFAWRDEPYDAFLKRAGPGDEYYGSPEEKEAAGRGIRLEAHADAVGQELLARAGYDPGLVAEAHAQRGGCGSPAGLTELPETHPVNAQRIVNAVLGRSAAAAAKSAASQRRLEAALPRAIARSSDAARRAVEALASAGGVAAASAVTSRLPPPAKRAACAAALGMALPPCPFQAVVSVHDFDDRGRLLPGRLAAARLRVPPPPADANPARKRAQSIAGSVVDFWIAGPFERAVDRLARGPGIGAEIIAACVRKKPGEMGEDYGVLGWTRRIAEDAALRLTRALSPGTRARGGGTLDSP